ncbi:hypothetical protein MOQ72_04430 [Saccharopolyspora sp. K220]|uniref:hypothetical protein n=1 Tax=Saccharopolyspora soli TaxID=2926618 RepID=UPI001F55CF46|nr:hypothetical protein [Saccharopolyspora soli]MCI2416659.1 hypothetical protein [Saccharopolyspora soli]
MLTTINAVSVTPDVDRRVLRVVELEKLGISQSKSYRRARPGGPWTRLAPGVLLIAPGPPTIEDRINAALLRAGPGAMITGLHAARLHGLETPPEDADIHVLIPHSRKIQSYPGTYFERTTRLPKPVYVNGIPLAPPVRAVMDGARSWRRWAFTERLLFEAIERETLCRLEELINEMELGSRRGTAVPRAILRSFKGSLNPPRASPARDAPPPACTVRNAA